ncbi:hypothetical protein DITRI_Ditri01bG0176100 [Diplodiscus trichospermus]
MEDSSNAILEGRRELMVSQAGGNFKVRRAHFIKPSIGLGSIDEIEIASVPRHCLSSLPVIFEPQKWPLEVKFCGWRYPQKNWKTWAVKMASLHEPTWKKAGIFEAIMNSIYQIERNKDLVLGIAERWCQETKSFIFSWGEATISLEDVMILGGYSVLGSPVFTPIETEEMEETWNKLNSARQEINRGTCRKVSHYQWMRKFMHSDSEIEHEAFLALWLSRFVLPSSFDVVVKNVFPIAIHLARGTRIALAPAVLATIYRDLSCLKQNIVASTQLESNCDGENVAVTVTLWSPLTLVQVWIWERFLDLQPKPNLIENGKPRLALWHGLKCKVQDLRSVLDSAKKRFVWCPYVRKIKDYHDPKFYGDKAMWISTDSSLDDELLSFARCLRASELVGLYCLEQYLPHRVALQFGMDQDIPGCVSRSNESPEAAWCDYNKSVGGGKLYIPPRLFEADVSARYLEWWKQSALSLQETSRNVLGEQRNFTDFKITPKKTDRMNESDDSTSSKRILKSLKRSKENDLGSALKRLKKLPKYPERKKGVHNADFVARSVERKKRGKDASVPPEFPPKSSKGVSEVNHEGKNKNASESSLSKPLKELPLNFTVQRELNNSPFPPGFPPKGNLLQAKGSFNEDKVTAQVPPGFTPECHVVEAKRSINEDKMTAQVPPGFTPKYNMVGAKSSINEDKMTPLVPPGFPPKCNMAEAKRSVDEVSPLVPPGFPPKRNMVEAKGPVHEDRVTPPAKGPVVEEKVTPPVVHGISPNHKTPEVRDFVEAKVYETIVRSACDHGSVGNKVGRNYEKSASHCRSLSMDSDGEDQLTVAEMLKSNHRLHNVDSRDVGDKLSGPCLSFSSSTADDELPRRVELLTALGAEKVMAAEVARGGPKGAATKDAIESNAGCPDKIDANINYIEDHGNSCLNEISRLNLEARISRLERLVAEIKAARNVMSQVTAWIDSV